MNMIINRPSPFPSRPDQSLWKPHHMGGERESASPKHLETKSFDQSCTPAVHKPQFPLHPQASWFFFCFFFERSVKSFSLVLHLSLSISCIPSLSMLLSPAIRAASVGDVAGPEALWRNWRDQSAFLQAA